MNTMQRKFTRLKDIHTLRQYRHDLSDCFPRAKDALLFKTVDALMTETQATSFPDVSPSLWLGRSDEKRVRETFAS
jgi:hypothetical protein